MECEIYAWIGVVKTWFQSHWDSIRDFGNSTFFTSIAGAFAGAWAGGRIAQVLATRAKDKEDLTREIRNANAAATMASALCDDLAGTFRQHVKPMKEAFDADLAAFSAMLAAPAMPGEEPRRFVANLQFLNGPSLHTGPLQQLVFSGVSSNRAIRLFSALSQSISNVASTNEK